MRLSNAKVIGRVRDLRIDDLSHADESTGSQACVTPGSFDFAGRDATHARRLGLGDLAHDLHLRRVDDLEQRGAGGDVGTARRITRGNHAGDGRSHEE